MLGIQLKDAKFVLCKGILLKVLGSEIAKTRTTDGLSWKNVPCLISDNMGFNPYSDINVGKFLQVLFVRCLAIPGTE